MENFWFNYVKYSSYGPPLTNIKETQMNMPLSDTNADALYLANGGTGTAIGWIVPRQYYYELSVAFYLSNFPNNAVEDNLKFFVNYSYNGENKEESITMAIMDAETYAFMAPTAVKLDGVPNWGGWYGVFTRCSETQDWINQNLTWDSTDTDNDRFRIPADGTFRTFSYNGNVYAVLPWRYYGYKTDIIYYFQDNTQIPVDKDTDFETSLGIPPAVEEKRLKCDIADLLIEPDSQIIADYILANEGNLPIGTSIIVEEAGVLPPVSTGYPAPKVKYLLDDDMETEHVATVKSVDTANGHIVLEALPEGRKQILVTNDTDNSGATYLHRNPTRPFGIVDAVWDQMRQLEWMDGGGIFEPFSLRIKSPDEVATGYPQMDLYYDALPNPVVDKDFHWIYNFEDELAADYFHIKTSTDATPLDGDGRTEIEWWLTENGDYSSIGITPFSTSAFSSCLFTFNLTLYRVRSSVMKRMRNEWLGGAKVQLRFDQGSFSRKYMQGDTPENGGYISTSTENDMPVTLYALEIDGIPDDYVEDIKITDIKVLGKSDSATNFTNDEVWQEMDITEMLKLCCDSGKDIFFLLAPKSEWLQEGDLQQIVDCKEINSLLRMVMKTHQYSIDAGAVPPVFPFKCEWNEILYYGIDWQNLWLKIDHENMLAVDNAAILSHFVSDKDDIPHLPLTSYGNTGLLPEMRS